MMKNSVEYFFKKGFLLTPDVVKFIDKMNVEFTSYNPPQNKLVLDIKDFEEGCDCVEIVKHLIKIPKEVSTQDFIKFYTSKYEKMKDVIQSRIEKEFVSLKEIKGDGWIIARVRKIKNHSLELEDLTGEGLFFGEFPDLDVDDVCCFRVENQKIKQILFPDVPLREPTKSKGRCCFIGDLHLDEAPYKKFEKFLQWFKTSGIKYLIVCGDVGDKSCFTAFIEKYIPDRKVFIIPGHDKPYPSLAETYLGKNIISLSNPSIIKINNIIVLVIHKFSKQYLKKRYLGKTKTVLNEDYLTLDIVPDIVHYGHDHKPFTSNYKSITLVNAGSLLTEFSPILIDFFTRETKQLSF